MKVLKKLPEEVISVSDAVHKYNTEIDWVFVGNNKKGQLFYLRTPSFTYSLESKLIQSMHVPYIRWDSLSFDSSSVNVLPEEKLYITEISHKTIKEAIDTTLDAGWEVELITVKQMLKRLLDSKK